MDPFDRKILAELQINSGISNAELAEKIGLSPSPCLRRVKALEEAGIIEGYSARLNRHALRLDVMAFIDVQLERQTSSITDAFLQEVTKLPQVIACYAMTGTLDFLLQVVASDLHAYADFVSEHLLKLPGVKDVRSSFVLREAKRSPQLPLSQVP